MSKLMAVIIWFVLVWLSATTGAAEPWPFEVTDLRSRDRLVILVFGDGGTGEAGQSPGRAGDVPGLRGTPV